MASVARPAVSVDARAQIEMIGEVLVTIRNIRQLVTTDSTFDTYKDHVGEYDGAWADGLYVYVTWTDGRLTSMGTQYPPQPT